MFSRIDRLKELFRREVVKILPTIRDPGCSGLITITDVDISPDLKRAQIFYSVLGDSRERLDCARALNRAAPYVRKILSRRVSTRAIPTVEFKFDPTPESAARIDKILNRIREGQS